jgi:hypothetical protein
MNAAPLVALDWQLNGQNAAPHGWLIDPGNIAQNDQIQRVRRAHREPADFTHPSGWRSAALALVGQPSARHPPRHCDLSATPR